MQLTLIINTCKIIVFILSMLLVVLFRIYQILCYVLSNRKDDVNYVVLVEELKISNFILL